jgi:class 3 adenylate cyclase
MAMDGRTTIEKTVASRNPFKMHPLTLSFRAHGMEAEYMRYIYGKWQLKLKIVPLLAFTVLLGLLAADVWNAATSTYLPLHMRYIFPLFRVAQLVMCIACVISMLILHGRPMMAERALICFAGAIITLLEIQSISETTTRASGFPAGGACSVYIIYLVRPRVKIIWPITILLIVLRATYAGVYYGVGLDRYTANDPVSIMPIQRIVAYECVVTCFHLIGMLHAIFVEKAMRVAFKTLKKTAFQTLEMCRECERTTQLLHNIIPSHLTDKIHGVTVPCLAQQYKNITVLYSDLVGFTSFCATVTPRHLLYILNVIVCQFDDLANQHQIEKIKSVGDAYFACSGITTKTLNNQTLNCVRMSLAMIDGLMSLNESHGWSFEMRVGVCRSTGTMIIIGYEKVTFDMIGDAVSIAEKLEQSCPTNKVHVSSSVVSCIDMHYTARLYDCDFTSAIQTYIIDGRPPIYRSNSLTLFDTASSTTSSVLNNMFEIEMCEHQLHTNVFVTDEAKLHLVPRSIDVKLSRKQGKHVSTCVPTRSFVMDTIMWMQSYVRLLSVVETVLYVGFVFTFNLLWPESAGSTHTIVMYCMCVAQTILTAMYIIPVFTRSLLCTHIYLIARLVTGAMLPYMLYAYDFESVTRQCVAIAFVHFVIVLNAHPFVIFPIKLTLTCLTLASCAIVTTIVGSVSMKSFNVEYAALGVIGASATLILFTSYQFHSSLAAKFNQKTKHVRLLNETVAISRRNNAIIQSALPYHIAMQLDANYLTISLDDPICSPVSNGCVAFVQIIGLRYDTEPTSLHSAKILNNTLSSFDLCVQSHSCTKIKSFGAVYLFVSGVENQSNDDNVHIRQILHCILDLRSIAHKSFASSTDTALVMKGGVHIGDFVAGIVGKTKHLYDVFGSTVNTASRACSTCEPDKIQCLSSCVDEIASHCQVTMRECNVRMKGIGDHVQTYWIDSVLSPTSSVTYVEEFKS